MPRGVLDLDKGVVSLSLTAQSAPHVFPGPTGKLLGIAIRSKEYLDLNLPPLFWKKLVCADTHGALAGLVGWWTVGAAVAMPATPSACALHSVVVLVGNVVALVGDDDIHTLDASLASHAPPSRAMPCVTRTSESSQAPKPAPRG